MVAARTPTRWPDLTPSAETAVAPPEYRRESWTTGTGEGTYLQREFDRTGRYYRTASCRVLSNHWRVVSNTLQWSRHAGLLRGLTWGNQPVSTPWRCPPPSWPMYIPWEWYSAEETESMSSPTHRDHWHRPSSVPHPADGTQVGPLPLPGREDETRGSQEPV